MNSIVACSWLSRVRIPILAIGSNDCDRKVNMIAPETAISIVILQQLVHCDLQLGVYTYLSL